MISGTIPENEIDCEIRKYQKYMYSSKLVPNCPKYQCLQWVNSNFDWSGEQLRIQSEGGKLGLGTSSRLPVAIETGSRPLRET